MAQLVADRPAEAGFLPTLRRLRQAQKSAKGAPPYSLYINRPLGRIFAAAAYQVGLTPNQVTWISAGFTFTGIGSDRPRPGDAAGRSADRSRCSSLGYALDAADGQLARLRGGGSMVGEWLDHMIDSAKIACSHLAVAVAFWRVYDLTHPAWLLVPLVFCGGVLRALLRDDPGRPAGPGASAQAGAPAAAAAGRARSRR